MSERIIEIQRRQIVTEIEVATTVPGEGGKFTGLIDAGTQESGISEQVIEQLAAAAPLAPDSYKRVASLGDAAGSTPAYRLWMGLRFGGPGTAPGFGGGFGTFWQIPSRPEGFDVLVGMDIIERFAVKIERGVCTLRRR